MHTQPKVLRKSRRKRRVPKGESFRLCGCRPPKNSRWGYLPKAWRRRAFTYLVRHHHASLWHCSFIIACAEAAWMHPHASLSETSSWRERLPLNRIRILTGLCVIRRRLATSAASPAPRAARARLVLVALALFCCFSCSNNTLTRSIFETARVGSCGRWKLRVQRTRAVRIRVNGRCSGIEQTKTIYRPSSHKFIPLNVHPLVRRSLRSSTPRPRPRPRPRLLALPAPQTPPLPPHSP